MTDDNNEKETTKETALVKSSSDPTLERVKDQYNHDRTIARAQNGKFAKKHRAQVIRNMKEAAEFFEGKGTDPTTGKPYEKTRHAMILDHIFNMMMTCSAEDLVGLSKAYSELQRSAFAKGKDRIIEENDPVNTRITTIMITMPQCPTGEPEKPQPTKPSFFDEPIKKPAFLDAEVVSTNGAEKK